MAVDTVRIRSVDDVVVAFFEPDRELTTAVTQRWLDAVAAPGMRKTLALTVGPVSLDPDFRRTVVETVQRHDMRIVAVTGDRLNLGVIGMFAWLGVPISAYPWSRLEDAARDVASRAELISPIVRAARALRAESPAAAGFSPDDG